MSNSISFSAGGIDVSSIVSSLMDVERAPISTLQTRQAAVKLQSDAVTRLKTNVTSLNTLANNILTSGITKLSSNVSLPSAVSVSIGSSARAGSVTFTVDALARAQGLRTATTVGASTSVVTTATALAISSTAHPLGIGSISVGPGVTAGKYDVTVTQATVGAVRTGSAATAASTLIDGTNNTLTIEVDGIAQTVTIASGTYTPAGLVDAVNTALDVAPAGATASLDATGRVRITTDHEGSAASLRVTGGNAMATLGLSVDAVAVNGTDGIVQIGSNPPVAVTSAGTGATIAVPTGTGDLTMTLDGPLRAGTSSVSVVSTGDRSLAAVAAAINGAGVGASASAVKVADGNWLLQVNATGTGVDHALSLDASVFAGVGGLLETSAARDDAQITIGSGPGAYSVTASGNVFSNLMDGVTLTATAESVTPVTVNVSRDDGATADVVDKLVAAVNSVLADIALQTKYDTKLKKGSPLSGDASVRRLAEQLRSSVTSIVGSTNQAASVGITTQRDGTLKFDRAVFQTALAADPVAVERVFGRGGSTTGGVRYASAADNTVAGTYAVQVTTAATRATTGVVLVGGSVAGQRIGVRVGSVTATYDAAPGATAADIAAGLNAALGEAGLTVNVEVSGGGVVLTSSTFGGGGAFDTNLDINGAGSWATSTGNDVVGTIDGQPAIGVGQRLRLLPTDTSSLARGLQIDVDEGAIGTLGPVSYDPGIAARLVFLATAATGDAGSLTVSSDTYEKKYDSYDEQISKFEERMVTKEAQLRRQWTTVQSLLTKLESQKDWLTNQLSAFSSSK